METRIAAGKFCHLLPASCPVTLQARGVLGLDFQAQFRVCVVYSSQLYITLVPMRGKAGEVLSVLPPMVVCANH